MNEECPFNVCWHGPCKEPAVTRGYCERHAAKVCNIKDCTEQAVAECNMTMQFVCGAPLCAEHRTAFHWGHNGC